MGTRALPDMYSLSPRASGIHIRQSTRAHVITYTIFYIYIYNNIYIIYIYVLCMYIIYIYIYIYYI